MCVTKDQMVLHADSKDSDQIVRIRMPDTQADLSLH